MNVHVEILSFEGCPHVAAASERVHKAIALEGVAARIESITIASVERAKATRFLGSPSIRIDGADVEPEADARTEFGLMCRTYRTAEAVDGSPSVEMIRSAIRLAKAPHHEQQTDKRPA